MRQFTKKDIITLDKNAVLIDTYSGKQVPSRILQKYSHWVVDDIYEDGPLNIFTLEDAGRYCSNVDPKYCNPTDTSVSNVKLKNSVINKAIDMLLSETPSAYKYSRHNFAPKKRKTKQDKQEPCPHTIVRKDSSGDERCVKCGMTIYDD